MVRTKSPTSESNVSLNLHAALKHLQRVNTLLSLPHQLEAWNYCADTQGWQAGPHSLCLSANNAT